MKKLLSVILLLAVAVGVQAEVETIETGRGVVRVEFLSPRIVRVLKTARTDTPVMPSLVVTMKDEGCPVSVDNIDANKTRLRSKALTVSIDRRTGLVTFASPKGETLLTEGDWGLTPITEGADRGCFRAMTRFALDREEPIYGIGLMENGKMNQRGENRRMIQTNLEDFQNVFQSLKGYALYWDNYSPIQLRDTPEEGMTLTSEVADGVGYYFMYGQSVSENVGLIRQLTGDVPMLPLWSYGFWQSRERYKSQGELTEVVDKYRQLGIPLDGIILDWQYWDTNYLWNAMEFLNPNFPDPKGMIDHVHKQDAHLAISIWQSFGPQTKPYRDLAERGLLFDFETWPQSGIATWPPRMDYPSGVRVYKPYTAEARDIYWQHLRRLFDLGVDVWWMDSTDPDHHSYKESDLDESALGGSEELRMKNEEFATALPTFRKLRNAFPLECVRGVYEHQRSDTTAAANSSFFTLHSSFKRAMILTRSGFAGQQRYASNVWTGDVRSDWPTLRNQIPMTLNFSLTGNPHTNTDIGGFFSGAYNRSYGEPESGARNPQFQELYVRWMQFGAFCPMMRSHGTETYRELYYFGKEGEPVYDALVAAIKLRYRLLPYIYSTAWQVTKNRDTFMRALVMDYPDDPKTHNLADEFLFGRSLLVAPIVRAQYTPEKRMKFDEMSGWDRKDGDNSQFKIDNSQFLQPKPYTIYLPKGLWYDYFSGLRYEGGRELTLQTTLATIPLFVPSGSIIPVGSEMQSVARRDWSSLELRVYPGRDGQFTLYEDDGETYAYEQGQYAEIPIQWNDRSRTLTLGRRVGQFSGMTAERTFTILLPDGTRREVRYTGKKVSVHLP